MPHDRKITRIVDALAGQGRVILWCDCHHKVSIDGNTWMAIHQMHRPTVGEVIVCPWCPDPPPVREEKTPQQLWKEAGEP